MVLANYSSLCSNCYNLLGNLHSCSSLTCETRRKMALPRRLVRQLREGTFRPSRIGRKAREAARHYRQAPVEPLQPPPPFISVKRRMKEKKHHEWYGLYNYNPKESARVVDRSSAYEKMADALGFSSEEMDEYASRASFAHAALEETGNAGELAIYLDYSFLWYH